MQNKHLFFTIFKQMFFSKLGCSKYILEVLRQNIIWIEN